MARKTDCPDCAVCSFCRRRPVCYRDLWRKKRNRRRKKHRKKAETDFPAKVCWLTGETDDKIVSAGQILKGKRTRGPETVLSRMRFSGGVPVRNHPTGQPAFNGLKAGNDCDQYSFPAFSLIKTEMKTAARQKTGCRNGIVRKKKSFRRPHGKKWRGLFSCPYREGTLRQYPSGTTEPRSMPETACPAGSPARSSPCRPEKDT